MLEGAKSIGAGAELVFRDGGNQVSCCSSENASNSNVIGPLDKDGTNALVYALEGN